MSARIAIFRYPGWFFQVLGRRFLAVGFHKEIAPIVLYFFPVYYAGAMERRRP
jgi:hypothetical protein